MLFAIGVLRKNILDLGKYNSEELARISELLKVLMNTRYFEYEGKLYEQQQGVPIGGTLSGLLAEVVLQSMEEGVLSKERKGLRLFIRYMDDLLIIWNKQRKKEDNGNPLRTERNSKKQYRFKPGGNYN